MLNETKLKDHLSIYEKSPNGVEVISQTVDTIKTHYSIDKNISDEDFNSYVFKINELISLKKQSQERRNNYIGSKDINYVFNNFKFNVLPTSITGFSVTIQNSDFQLALRNSKNKINGSPLIKAEFRAEFLARVGYIKALEIVNTFIKKNILSSYIIHISEIHLATDIQGYDFKVSDFVKMKTRMRTGVTHDEEALEAKGSIYGTVTTFTGFTFGKGDYMMRIYNKTKEIEKNKNKSFAEFHLWSDKPNYNPDKTVWRLEIQVRRAKLKKLVNHNGNTMDNYYNCLNGIPNLWAKSLEDYEMKDLSRENIANLSMMSRVLKDGTEIELSKGAIQKIFERTPSLPFWDYIKSWNTHTPKSLSNTPKIPRRGSQEYVNNSIKSLYSTLAKYKGSVNSTTLIEAFKEANEDNLHKKEVSLLEDNFNKQLDWMDLIDCHVSAGVLNTPSYKDLESNIANIVLTSDEHIKNVYYSESIVERIEARLLFTSNDYETSLKDLNYLNSLVNRLETQIAFRTGVA